MKTIHGIYKITNKINQKSYIGSAAGKRGVIDRWYQHKSQLKNKRHSNNFLQKAYNKYGAENFIYEIIEECSPELCLEREQFYLDLFKSYDSNNGYNLCRKAGNTLGRSHSLETRKKISDNRIYGEPANKGRVMGDVFIKKVSLAQRQSKICQENIKKLNTSKRKPVIGVHSITGEVLKLSHAGADPRFINSGIQQCCKGKFKTYKGYKWSYDVGHFIT